MTEDGFIFISIGEEELDNLKKYAMKYLVQIILEILFRLADMIKILIYNSQLKDYLQ